MDNEVNRVGVGPCPKPWPTGDEYDKYLLENGDRRNVEDKYIIGQLMISVFLLKVR